MGINQDDNQVENQDEKNISCNVFLEQIELLNQLPMSERGSVIYMALLKAFGRVSNQVENQDDNQLENQLENTYISISKSISLSKLSITVLNLLNKTLDCKIYSKNWGGKRIGSGKPSKENQKNQKNQNIQNEQTQTQTINLKPNKKEIKEYCSLLGKHIDIDSFCAYYEASNWEDKNGLPINWKQKVISWSLKQKQEEDIYNPNRCLF